MIIRKSLLAVWAIAFLTVVSAPVVSLVKADPCNTGDESCYEYTGDPPRSDPGDLWGDAFNRWCVEDGYNWYDCEMATDQFRAAVNRYIAGMTVTDPRPNYAAYYPGGSKGAAITAPPSIAVKPGEIGSPVPYYPERLPSTRCACHEGSGVSGGVS